MLSDKTALLLAKSIAQFCSFALTTFILVRQSSCGLRKETDCLPSSNTSSISSNTPAARILRAAWSSDLAFSIFGLIYSVNTLVHYQKDQDFRYVLYLQAPHWSFQVSSFCWMGVLAIYLTSRNRAVFDVTLCHYIIWTLTLFYWILEIFAIFRQDNRLITLATLLWKVAAVINFIVVVVCWFIHAKRARKRLKRGQLVISKLVSCTICFILFVSPNIIAECIHGTKRKLLIQHIFSILLQLWPAVNILIALTRTTWCLFFLPNKAYCFKNYTNDHVAKKELSASLHELMNLEIGEKIGEGIAVVHLGKWRGVQVAVKMKSVAFDTENDAAEFQHACNLEIQQEANVMKQLSHPNIVLFMGAGFYNGSICIISEYCARGSLRDVLEQKRCYLRWATKIRLALGIAHGMQYLHSANPVMIHRDLKSPNILVDDSWHAKIADFGTLRFAEIVTSVRNSIANARDFEPSVMTGLVGTTRWMAPEVILGNKRYSAKVDIYSLGFILWELIDGKLPFENIRWNHEIEKVIVQGLRPSIRPECPARYKALILDCWSSDPEKRPSIQQVIRSLQRLAREEFCGTASSLETRMDSLSYVPGSDVEMGHSSTGYRTVPSLHGVDECQVHAITSIGSMETPLLEGSFSITYMSQHV